MGGSVRICWRNHMLNVFSSGDLAADKNERFEGRFHLRGYNMQVTE